MTDEKQCFDKGIRIKALLKQATVKCNLDQDIMNMLTETKYECILPIQVRRVC